MDDAPFSPRGSLSDAVGAAAVSSEHAAPASVELGLRVSGAEYDSPVGKIKRDVDAAEKEFNKFTGTVFANVPPGEHPLLALQSGDGFTHAPAGDEKRIRRWLRSGDRAIYFNVSTIRAPEPCEDGSIYWRRQKEDCVTACVLVLDDIGTKAKALPVEPSYKLESSEGNFQWGYLIHPTKALERYAAIVAAVAALGCGDAGASGYNRLMRVPGSCNTKPKRNNFISRITDWHPERRWGIDELAIAMGVDLATLDVPQPRAVQQLTGGDTVVAGGVADPVLTWLAAHGHVMEDNGREWVKINCLWHAEHTTGDDLAGYSPLGRGDGDWAKSRGFKCQHAHCQDRHYREFREWVEGQGGPRAARFDPLPWLQHNFAVVASGRQVADLRVPRPASWLKDVDEFALLHPGTAPSPVTGKPVPLKKAFLEDFRTRRVDQAAYAPGQPVLGRVGGDDIVNLWTAPQHPETDADPETFLKHIEYLLPDEAEKEAFLNWLAFKLQHPELRSWGVVMVADNAYGIGRSWLSRMMSAVLPVREVRFVNFGELTGKGSMSERNYNDWGADCQIVVVEEAKDFDRSDARSAYETMKRYVDTSPTTMVINPKYGRKREVRLYFNLLILTNHADALVIPADNRRLTVFTNPTDKHLKEGYYADLEAALAPESGEPARVYQWLMRRDLLGFDHVNPPATAGKDDMVEEARTAAEVIRDHLRETMPGDLVTR